MDKFLDNLEPFAQNKTPISLRNELALLTLNVLSKVSSMKECCIVNFIKISLAGTQVANHNNRGPVDYS